MDRWSSWCSLWSLWGGENSNSTRAVGADMTQKRKIIVHIATSADGYIARPDGNLDWLTSRPAPKGFYGMPEFTRSVDAKLLGRKTFDVSVEMGAPFSAHDRHYVFSRRPPPASVPAGVEFVTQSISAFAERLRDQPGKNIWMMGGGELIASFLDEDAIDEFIITVVPIFIGEGTPLIAPRHRDVPLKLHSVKPFPDGVVQVHYDLRTKRGLTPKGDTRVGRRRR
jgi:dihydrofolate reductase